jgi:hypothetical protein
LVAKLIRHPQPQFWPDSLSLLALHHGGGRQALWLIEA